MAVGSWELGVSWDPYEFGGRLRTAEPQTFLYPPVLRTWASDAWLTLVSYVLHVWLGAFAVYVLARRLNVGPLTGLMLALAYMLATTLAVPPARVSAEVVFRAAWLPLLAAAMPMVVCGVCKVVTAMEPVPVALPMVFPVTVPIFTEPSSTRIPVHAELRSQLIFRMTLPWMSLGVMVPTRR